MTRAPLSKRAARLKPSPTLAMATKAKQMKADGINVVSFAAGEPDFDTPGAITEAAKLALDRGKTRYSPTPGSIELRTAVAEKLKRENGLDYAPQECMVSTGAKQCVYNALQVLVDEGDEVVVPAPFWMTYESQIELSGGTAVIVPSTADEGFFPPIERIESALTPRSRAIVLNSPNNPTGAGMPSGLIDEIGRLAVERDLWIVSDEIYEHLTYGHDHRSIATVSADVKSRTVTITGCSKSYAMTGWRIGFVCGPRDVVQAMTNLQDQVTSGPTTFSQEGAVAALSTCAPDVASMRSAFHKRRDLILDILRQIPDVSVRTPEGAFYVFPDVLAYLQGEVSDDVTLADWLLENANVATVPGSVFYGPGHLRLSYACSEADIVEGLDRMAAALAKIRK